VDGFSYSRWAEVRVGACLLAEAGDGGIIIAIHPGDVSTARRGGSIDSAIEVNMLGVRGALGNRRFGGVR
jgi:hypothetical protein